MRSFTEFILTPVDHSSKAQAILSPELDVFVTYRCGLRCSHCFMGANLGRVDMGIDVFASIIRQCHEWGTRRVTLLGGEPTLYPHFDEALRLLDDTGLACRIVTNGHVSFQRHIERSTWRRPPYVCFSVDGSSPAVHDRIRGAGSFAALAKSVSMSKDSGIVYSGIVSVSRENAHDTVSILERCRSWGMEYANVHYVTSRGFAHATSVLGVREWQRIYNEVVHWARDIDDFSVRIERTFGDSADGPIRCAVQDRTNLMFLPDGRVFHCMMFIDQPGAHAFEWLNGKLTPNFGPNSEVEIAGSEPLHSCPALPMVNQSVSEEIPTSSCALCIYQKDRI